ncbi:hypothetical protein [Methylobacterium platani]|uniref:Uncharacterized protein n=2 Tax=Methylobacterium platani TaxID=427683 RepID=A0A179SEI9_9HYPH|nr:hypothetical protein [Methylobacterium platani]KMO15957.1 hypothetical protein SQ03_15930 [Methylobacterium platani JCM 14648]OAS24897.1 hypothetical protein A5481_12455 [Methylobacterium platani]
MAPIRRAAISGGHAPEEAALTYHRSAHEVGTAFETAAYGIAGAIGSALIAGRAARAERDAETADAWLAVAARVRAGRIAAARARQADAARADAARRAEDEQRLRILMLRARATAA